MGFLNTLLGDEKQPTKDFDLISQQINSYYNMLDLGKPKKELNEIINNFLALKRLSEVLNSVEDHELDKIKFIDSDQLGVIEKLKFKLYDHEDIDKFIDVFQNGIEQGEGTKNLRILHSKNELGLNTLQIL